MFPVSDDNKKASYRREGKIVRRRKRDRECVNAMCLSLYMA